MKKLVILALIMICSSLAFAINTSNCPDNTVSYWKFDQSSGQVVDSYDGNNGTAGGGVTRGSAGQVNGSFNFDGVDDIVTFPSDSSFDLGSVDFTILSWVKLDSVSHTTVLNRRTLAHRSWDAYIHTDGEVYFLYSTTGTGGGQVSRRTTDAGLTPGNWYHIVWSRNASSGKLKIFVNGDEKTLDNDAVPNFTNKNLDVCVGTNYCDGGIYSNASIDEIALINRALTEEEAYYYYLEGYNNNKHYCEIDINIVCGNGKVGIGEDCDDGNAIDGDGCNTFTANCQYVCGDGDIQGAEECDDSNVVDGDGCSSACLLESVDPAECTVDSLISYWPFDNVSFLPFGTTVYDFFGDNDGLINGATYVPGKINGAYNFDGVDDDITFPSDPSFNLGSVDFSITGWVNLDSYNYFTLLNRRLVSSSQRSWGVFIDTAGELSFVYVVGTTQTGRTTTDAGLGLGTWYHVAFTRNTSSGKLKAYVNGVEKTLDSDVIPNFTDKNLDVCMGSNYCDAGIGIPTNATIDEVAMFNKTLSASEVMDLYLEGSSSSPICSFGDNGTQEEVVPEVSDRSFQIFMILIVSLLVGAALFRKN